MNRRELLKFSLLSPLLGLFKKKEEGFTVAKLKECNNLLEKACADDFVEIPYGTPPLYELSWENGKMKIRIISNEEFYKGPLGIPYEPKRNIKT